MGEHQLEFGHLEAKPFIASCFEMGVSYGPGWPDEFGDVLCNWTKESIGTPIRTLSLFTGAGGLDIGFHDSGFDIRTIIEIDNSFVETIKANCGEGKRFRDPEVLNIDIREYHPPEGNHVDFIIGGPPCQTFSAAGRRAAGVQGTCDDRGTLFEEYVRILKLLSPRGFLFENVYGIMGAEKGAAWTRIRQAFEEAGYHVYHRILDAADFGVPQHRERLFIVGVKNGRHLFPRPTHGPDSLSDTPFYSSGEAVRGVRLSDTERNMKLGGRFGDLLDEIPPGLNYSFFTEKMGHPQPIFAWRSKFSDFLYKSDPETPTRALKAQGGQYTGPFHWRNRPFSVGELKRLQTIPDDYEIIGSKQKAIMQIGNSVPPQLGRILALSILKQLFKIEPPLELAMLEEGQVLGFRKRKRQLTAIYRKKAEDAIDAIGKSQNSHREKTITGRSYHAKLDEGFKLSVSSEGDNAMNLEFSPSEEQWMLFVSDCKGAKRHGFTITISPTDKSLWILPAKQVLLEGVRAEPMMFTLLWKAFEAELIRLGIKADLVQLCGYYQYKPSFDCIMELAGNKGYNDEWGVLQSVVSGGGVREIMCSESYSEIWGVPKDEVMKYMKFLRELGYETRNHNTNPQIPEEHYLIPYCFPTLNPMSVQLRKSLEG